MIENLRKTVMNEGQFAATIHELKTSKPTKAELGHGATERRNEARAEVSRKVMPI